jgi:3-hydroxyisobutyrate dehydrogenase
MFSGIEEIDMSTPSVALLGLGTMGNGMAQNLLKAGFPLTVYNRTASKAEALSEMGARVARTPAEAAKGVQMVISMLADDQASRDAWLGSQGAVGTAEPGTLLIESSTVSPDWIAELGAAATARGLHLLDAPVTGSRMQAAGGQLSFLVGGSREALARATPIFAAMGKETIHLGPLGSGAKLKLVNNFLCGVQVASLAEGIAWLERSGLDREKSLAFLKSGAPGSPLVAGLSARMTARDYTVHFLLRLMSKDLQYAHDAASAAGVDLTTAANARALFEQAIAQGHAEQDMSAVIEPLRTRTP